MMKNNSLHKIFPFLAWLKKYNLNFFSSDLLAGLTVGVMLIPQGMAYAMLAGVPPIYGLYSATIPLFVYAFWGSSMQVSVGPVAMASLLVSSTLFTLPQGTDWAAAAFNSFLGRLVSFIFWMAKVRICSKLHFQTSYKWIYFSRSNCHCLFSVETFNRNTHTKSK